MKQAEGISFKAAHGAARAPITDPKANTKAIAIIEPTKIMKNKITIGKNARIAVILLI